MTENGFKYRMARKEAGLTSCVACRDTGSITRGQGAGGGRIGYCMWTETCRTCRCFWCNEILDKEGAGCKGCEEKLQKKYKESIQETEVGHEIRGPFRDDDTASSDN